MLNGHVPLERSFSLVPSSENDSDEQDYHSFFGVSRPTGWPDLEEEFRCVILAEAGAGKSFEMAARAKHIMESARTAFFIRIEDIEHEFDVAFEVGTPDSLESWLNSKGEAWFFLDSVDEARLEHPRAFERAIQRFANRIKPALHRAHVFITSRPYAWRSRSDRALMEKWLPLARRKTERASEDTTSEYIDAEDPSESDSALRVYLLDPLDESGIRMFADFRETPKVDRLILDLQRASLMSMAARPFDLEDILAKWRADQTLDGRLELLQHNLDLRLSENDPNRAQRQPLSREKARRGARILAAAVILTGEPGIRIPDSDQTNKGIDAESVLGDWKPDEIQALLERGVFDDVLYGIVRFRHREVRELLAAEWFIDQLKSGNSRNSTQELFFREQYGHPIIAPRLRPILHWLILFDDEIRHKALQISPEVAIEGGDASRLPLSERKTLLSDIVSRISEDEDNHASRDNSSIARIAQPDLSEAVLRLIIDYRTNDDAIFFLARLVWQGEMTTCVPAMLDIASDQSLNIYARMAAARSVMTCGTREERDLQWNQLNASTAAMPRRILAVVLDDADADIISVRFLLDSINKLEDYQRYESTGLNRALHRFIDRLPVSITTDRVDPLAELVIGLNSYLEEEPYIEQRDHNVSEKFMWLLGPATHAVDRLVSTQSRAAHSSGAISIMLKVPVARFWRGGDFDEYKGRLHETVPAWKELNDRLFWRSVEEARNRLKTGNPDRLIDDWPVQWRGHYWKFEADRFSDVLGFVKTREFLDDKLVALSLSYRIFLEAQKPREWLVNLERVAKDSSDLKWRLDTLLNPTTSKADLELKEKRAQHDEKQKKEKEERDRKRAEWVEHIRAKPDVVLHPPGLEPGEFSKDQCWLLVQIEGIGRRTNRREGANWEALIPEFGEEVAKAYRKAATLHWRNFTPGLRSEGQDTRSIPYSLVFAMAGLEIEANENSNFPENLTEPEIHHALRYIVWELNGFPDWLEQVHRVHPEIVLNAVFIELQWELENTKDDQPQHYILHDLVYYAPWMHPNLATSIAEWVSKIDAVDVSIIHYCIHILQSGGIKVETISELAQSKVAKEITKEQWAIWYALWVDVDAENAVPAVSKWLSSLSSEDASTNAQLFITSLMGTRRSSLASPGKGDFRKVKHLKTLYILMHRHIRARDDIERAGTGVYSPELRDDAQDGRNALLSQLSEIPGKEAYVALTDLAKNHPDTHFRPWMRALAYRRAEEDADLELWSAKDVLDYDRYQLRTPTTHQQLFDLTVARLNELKSWIEHGNDSPYKTWQRANEETELRNLVSGWLNSRSFGRYSCAQENELPNRQRPDIWIQNTHVSSPVPIELKLLDKGWTGPKLCERLQNQLAGDYLRDEASGFGIMLLVWQGRSSKSRWKVGDRKVSLADLEGTLKSYWNSISNRFPGVIDIKVIVIDLTVRELKSET